MAEIPPPLPATAAAISPHTTVTAATPHDPSSSSSTIQQNQDVHQHQNQDNNQQQNNTPFAQFNPFSNIHNTAPSLFFPTLPKLIQNLVNNLTSLITIKLDEQNYTIWRHQMENALYSNQLIGFADGTYSCPTSPPSSVQEWQLIDRNVVSAILATLSPTLILHFLEYNTASSLFRAIKERFAALSQTHIHELKKRLFKTTKETTMEAYIVTLKNIADSLAAAGAPVCNEDLVFLTLEGLTTEYASFKTTIVFEIQL